MAIWPQISIDTRNYKQCFGCGQDNPIGLKLSFQWDGKTARANFTPTELYQGWSGLLHGGITTCILDEAMSWAVLFEGINCVTTKIQARLRRPASINEPLIVTASITRRTRKLVESSATLLTKDGSVIAEGSATQFIVNTNVSNAKNKGV